MSAAGLLRGILLSAFLLEAASAHCSARAEALAHQVAVSAPDRLAPILDISKLPLFTLDGRPISRKPRHHIQNVLMKRIARGEIPPPENVSLKTLLLVAGKLADLSQSDPRRQRSRRRDEEEPEEDELPLGAWMGLAKFARETKTSASQLRLVFGYLETHGHGLNHGRLCNEDRMVGDAKMPLTDTRTTVRNVFPITCEMYERLSEDEINDLIAFGEKKAVVKPLPVMDGVVGIAGVVTTASFVPPPPPRRRALAEPVTEDDVAGELRCLVAPLNATLRITGFLLPLVWVADEADRAGLLGDDALEDAADAICELNKHLLDEQRAAEAMGERPPKIGGASGLQKRTIRYLEGKTTWIAAGGKEARLRDEARDREAAHAAALTPEQRERRAPEMPRGLSETPADLVAPYERPAPTPPTVTEQRTALQRTISAANGALGSEFVTGAVRKQLEVERDRAMLDLTALIDTS